MPAPGGVPGPGGMPPPVGCLVETPRTATAAGGTHPTGIHSWFTVCILPVHETLYDVRRALLVSAILFRDTKCRALSITTVVLPSERYRLLIVTVMYKGIRCVEGKLVVFTHDHLQHKPQWDCNFNEQLWNKFDSTCNVK